MKKPIFLTIIAILFLAVPLIAQDAAKKPAVENPASDPLVSEADALVKEGDALLREGDVLFAQNDIDAANEKYDEGNQKYDEAIEKFNEAIEKNPKLTEAHLGLGTVFISTGRLDEAMDLLEPAAKEHSKSPDLKLLLARAYYWAAKRGIDEQRDGIEITSYFNDAARVAEESISLDPEKIEAMILLGDIRYNQSDFTRAAEVLRKALQVNPEEEYAAYLLGEVLQLSGKYQDAAKAFLKLSDKFEHQKAYGLYKAGTCYEKFNQIPNALNAYKSAIEADENYQSAYDALWTMYAKNGQYKEVLGVYKDFVKTNADNPKAYFYLAYVYKMLKMNNDALKNYQEAIEKSSDKKYPGAHYYRGEILQSQGKTQEAIQELFTALEQDKAYDNPYDMLRVVSGNYILKNQLKNAEKILSRLIEYRPDDGYLRNDLALVYRDSGQYAKSLEQYVVAAELLPEDPQVLNDCGVIYQYHMNQPEKAVPLYKKSEELGNNLDAMENLGQILYENGQYEKSLIRFKKVLLQQPNRAKSSGYYYRCVKMLKKNGVDIKALEDSIQEEME